jgi:hypothetical protein
MTVFIEHNTLPVYGHGNSLGEALSSFLSAYHFQRVHLVAVPEASLTSGGLARRRAMLEFEGMENDENGKRKLND